MFISGNTGADTSSIAFLIKLPASFLAPAVMWSVSYQNIFSGSGLNNYSIVHYIILEPTIVYLYFVLSSNLQSAHF